MRVFISADIEGTAFTTIWPETDHGEEEYPAAAKQMTMEVKAACEGAIAAGADYIVVKDAHDGGRNIDLNEMPKCVEVIRASNGSPRTMVEGIEAGFDAALFIGYHSAAGKIGNPLSHTFTTKTTRVLLNGEDCSEFMIYSWCAAYYGVPTVFLSGDKMLTEDSLHLHPMLKTVWAKDGYGGYTRCRQPQLVCDLIRAGVEESLKQDLSKAMCELPKHFDLQISYKEHRDAARYVNYPGFEMVDSHTIRMQTDDYYEFLRCVPFVF